MKNLFNTSGINLHAKCSSTLIFMPTFCCYLTPSLHHPHHHHYRWTFQPFFLCSNFSIFLTRLMPSFMKQSIKELCYELFIRLFRVPPSWKQQQHQHQQEGLYKLILFNLNLFIAKNFFIMRLFSPRCCRSHFILSRNNINESFSKINDLRDER